MTKKLSVIQAEVLRHMAQGQKLHCARGLIPWLDGIPDPDGDRLIPPRVHSNTWLALLKRGCIVRDDAYVTPWWRQDYAITNIGRNLLQDAGLPMQPVLKETE